LTAKKGLSCEAHCLHLLHQFSRCRPLGIKP
jgi:hypothetical protein